MLATLSLLLLMAGSAPDTFLLDEEGRVVRFRAVEVNRNGWLSRTEVAPDGKLSPATAVWALAHRPTLLRASPADGYQWGVFADRPIAGGAFFHGVGIVRVWDGAFGESTALSLSDFTSEEVLRLPSLAPQKSERPISESRLVAALESLGKLVEKDAAMVMQQPGLYTSRFLPYLMAIDSLPDIHSSLGGRGPYPLATIAAIDHESAIIMIYCEGHAAWFKIAVGEEFLSPYVPKSSMRSLSVEFLGVTSTVIYAGATSFWVDDKFHAISDDGAYEQFSIKNGQVRPVSHLLDLPTPQAICLGAERLWTLSENPEGGVIATEIKHQLPMPAVESQLLENVGIEQAAASVLLGSAEE